MARITLFLFPAGKRAHPVVAYWPPARASAVEPHDPNAAVHSMEIAESLAGLLEGIRFSSIKRSVPVKVVIESLVANAYNIGFEHGSKTRTPRRKK